MKDPAEAPTALKEILTETQLTPEEEEKLFGGGEEPTEQEQERLSETLSRLQMKIAKSAAPSWFCGKVQHGLEKPGRSATPAAGGLGGLPEKGFHL